MIAIPATPANNVSDDRRDVSEIVGRKLEDTPVAETHMLSWPSSVIRVGLSSVVFDPEMTPIGDVAPRCACEH